MADKDAEAAAALDIDDLPPLPAPGASLAQWQAAIVALPLDVRARLADLFPA